MKLLNISKVLQFFLEVSIPQEHCKCSRHACLLKMLCHNLSTHGLCAKEHHQLVEILQLQFVSQSTFFQISFQWNKSLPGSLISNTTPFQASKPHFLIYIWLHYLDGQPWSFNSYLPLRPWVFLTCFVAWIFFCLALSLAVHFNSWNILYWAFLYV